VLDNVGRGGFVRAIVILVVLTLSFVAAQAQRHAGDEPAMCDKVFLTPDVKIATKEKVQIMGTTFDNVTFAPSSHRVKGTSVYEHLIRVCFSR
jgi:hypothetical protein